MTPGISIRPSDMVEGGAVPVDKNLTWKECRFQLFDYQGKAPPTTAARILLVDDDGQEYPQFYSAGDPARLVPAPDGKTLIATGAPVSVSKSSNFHILMNALVNAGFPENRLSDDISVLDGLVAYHIGMPEPKRTGMAPRATPADGSPVREKIISIPSKVIKLPWDKKGGKAPAGKASSKATAADVDVTEQAIAFITKVLESEDSITRQQLAVRVFKEISADNNKDAVAAFIYAPEGAAAMVAAGLKIEGEKISQA